MAFDRRLDSARIALKLGLGLAALLAGLDKYFDLLANWPGYVSPLVTAVVRLSRETLMYGVGVVEMAVGLATLTRWAEIGSYVAAVWLVAIALNLVTTGRFFDVAVRDVEMAIAAYTLARLTEVRRAATRTVDSPRGAHHQVAAA
jgi:hypothetical protein